jgi:hypothetical protein
MYMLFAMTLFLGAALLFWIEPMFAKMVLPLLGGSPAVWNTCAVFFQAAVLAGYAYAHVAPARLGMRRHAALHLGLLLLPLLILPVAVPGSWYPPLGVNPIPWLLSVLFVAVGLPFFMVATTAPLLQTWFTRSGHPAARDPYFLYAASNLGGLVGLLSYPLLLEPNWSLTTHSRIWTLGYGTLVLLTLACAVVLWRSPRDEGEPGGEGCQVQNAPVVPIGWGRKARWLALAFVPSSLMLSVTTYLTTDIAAIPLLWVVPLALYLLTFIAAFARRPPLPHRFVVRTMPMVVLLVALLLFSGVTGPTWLLLPLHFVGLGVVALACHGELARDRPAARQLTAFYLWLSLGGVLGGLFNALAAPLLFPGVAEYPMVLALAALLLPAQQEQSSINDSSNPKIADCNEPFLMARADLLFPLGLGLLTAVLIVGANALPLPPGAASVGAMFAVPAVICYSFRDRPLRFGLGLGALFLAGLLDNSVHGRVEHRQRSFFGVHRITIDEAGTHRLLFHGNTVHGCQNLDPARRGEPLTYYHRTGPIGVLFQELEQSHHPLHEVAVVGLGAGSLAAYGRPGQHWTFYEIDPAVVDLSRDSGYFTFLRDSAASLDFVLGDARLRLAQGEERRYGLIVIDAFGSDATPVHLLTREALRVYLARLGEDGILAFHISNRYVNLRPVLAELAHDANLTCLAWEDTPVSASAEKEGKYPSSWVVMSRSSATLSTLQHRTPWSELRRAPGQTVWTDDFADLLRQLGRLN